MKLTEDFNLEPLVVKDASSLYSLMVSNVERFQLFLPKTLAQNMTLEDSRVYILKKNDEHKTKSQFTFAIKEKLTNSIAGLIILKNIHKDILQAEFAYCIGEQFAGKRLTSVAVSKVIQFANKELALSRFQIIAHKTNAGSAKVALNNNFTWSKTLIDEFTPEGQSSLNMELYELSIEY
jgi:ribosomal-protein-alanine N-acetyltransferase